MPMIDGHRRAVRRRHRRPADDLNAVVDVVGDAAKAVTRVDATQRREVNVEVVKRDRRVGTASTPRILTSRTALNLKRTKNQLFKIISFTF